MQPWSSNQSHANVQRTHSAASQRAAAAAHQASRSFADATRRTHTAVPHRWHTARTRRGGSSALGAVAKLFGLLIWLALLGLVVKLAATALGVW